MLTEARDLAEELGDTEIRAEAMAWRVPAFVALCDLESARREVAALRETAEQTAQPFMLHVAEHYGSAIALVRRAPRRGRGAGAPLARVEPAADRTRRLRRLRHPDVQRPARAGAARGARPGDPDPRRRGGSRGARGARGSIALLAELGMETEARRELVASARRGARRLPRVALARVARVPHRRVRGARRRERRRARLPGARAARGRERDDRPPGLLLRRRRPLPRHARRDARRMGARRGALRARAGAQPAHGRRDLARAHRLRVRAPAARARSGDRDRAAALLGEAAALAERIGMPTLLGRIRGARTRRPGGRGRPTASRRARCRSCASSPGA